MRSGPNNIWTEPRRVELAREEERVKDSRRSDKCLLEY